MLYNQFETMPQIPYKIINALTDNDNLFKLIYYPTYDALSQPNLTIKQKMDMLWQGQSHIENYNIYLTNIQPDMEMDSKVILKCYRYHTNPISPVISTVAYKFDVMYGTTIPLVEYNGTTCNRGDLIEMELMKSLNGKDVAGVGFLQYNHKLSTLCSSTVGIGNNYTFTGTSIVMATQIGDVINDVC